MGARVHYDFGSKVAVVTGGSRGIGLAAARAFAQAGASVAVCARTAADVHAAEEELEGLARQAGAGGHALGLVADVSQAEDMQRFVQETVARFGGVDVAVSNAGGSEAAPFLQLKDEQLLAGWELKLLGAIRLTRGVVPIMEARGGGSVVCIGATTAKEPTPERVTAATTCTAMRAFVKAVAPDLAHRGVNINIIQPGLVRTRRQVLLAEFHAKQRGVLVEQVLREQAAAIPTGRVTEPEEVAELILFLASRTVPNLTGAEIVLDGAATKGL